MPAVHHQNPQPHANPPKVGFFAAQANKRRARKPQDASNGGGEGQGSHPKTGRSVRIISRLQSRRTPPTGRAKTPAVVMVAPSSTDRAGGAVLLFFCVWSESKKGAGFDPIGIAVRRVRLLLVGHNHPRYCCHLPLEQVCDQQQRIRNNLQPFPGCAHHVSLLPPAGPAGSR